MAAYFMAWAKFEPKTTAPVGPTHAAAMGSMKAACGESPMLKFGPVWPVLAKDFPPDQPPQCEACARVVFG